MIKSRRKCTTRYFLKMLACKLVREGLPQLEVFYLGFSRLFIHFANQALGFGLNYPLKKDLHLLFLTSVFVV